MVSLVPVPVAGGIATGITVELPRTHLVIVSGSRGYIMCGALDVALLDAPHMRAREIVAARAVGVKSIADLLAAPLESVTSAAAALGLQPGMAGRDALALLL